MNGLKEAFSRENLLKDLNFFALLNLGLVLTAVGIVYFKNPNHFAFGGTSGGANRVRSGTLASAR